MTFPEIDLKSLYSFVVVAQELHFSRAAERLNISQPPLTQRIQRLEEKIGYALFKRGSGSRFVQLTPAGTELLHLAKQLLSQSEQGLEAVRGVGAGKYGKVRVGFAASVAFSILPPLIKMFRHRYPHIVLDLIEQNTTPLIQSLQNGAIDIGLLREPPDKLLPLEHFSVYKEPLMVALPSDHRFSTLDTVPLKLLAQEPFILFRPQSGPKFYSRITALCEWAGFVPNVIQEVGEWSTVIGLVTSDIGISLVPKSITTICPSGISYRPIDFTDSVLTISLCWRKSEIDPAVLNFVDIGRHFES